MCGILGYLAKRHFEEGDVTGAMDSMDTRGPDGRGTKAFDVTSGSVGLLGHLRLSILDLSDHAAQPMVSSRTGNLLSFNGEIYNFSELRSELAALGCTFNSSGDSEVLLAAYDMWGVDCLSRFNGMFAFAIWDKARELLVLARDRLGIKPLYYCHRGQSLTFASTLRGVARLRGDCGLHREAFAGFFAFGYFPGRETALQGVEKLQPGHLAEFDPATDQLKVHEWWDARNHIDTQSPPEEEALEALDFLVRDSVRLRLISDVPLGIFLSGGIDSSLITAAAATGADHQINTFSIGFEESASDEAKYAAEIAGYLKTRHREKIVQSEDFLSALPEILQGIDEPFSDSSLIPTHILSRMTRDHVTVALSGDGGDETHLGYIHHHRAGGWHKVQRLPLPLRRLAAQGAGCLPSLRAKRFAQRFGAGSFGQYYAWMLADTRNGLAKDLTESAAFRFFDELESSIPTGASEGFPAVYDLYRYLPDDILWKSDRASMAHSLEVRVPLLDHRLVEYALSLSPEFRRKNGELKYLLKCLLGRYVPDSLWNRPKQGFAIPLGQWFRGPLRDWIHSELEGVEEWGQGIVPVEDLERILASHDRGEADYKRILWGLVTLRAWFRNVGLSE